MRMVVACNEVTERERQSTCSSWSMIQTLSTQQIIHRTMLWVSRLWICLDLCLPYLHQWCSVNSPDLAVSLTCSDSDIFQWFGTFRNHVRDLPCKSHGYSNATVVAQRRQCWCQASSARVHDQLIYKWIHSPLNQGGVTELVQFGFAVWLMCSRYRWWNIVKPE